MRKKIFKPVAIGGATALISLTSLLSYVIGLARDRIIAVNFGTTKLTDAYNTSFIIPDALFNLFIAGALSAAFLPIFSKYLTKSKEEAHELANTILTGATVLITILSTIAFIFMGQIVAIAFKDISLEMQTEIINMTRLLLPSAILFAISNTLGIILMTYRHFIAYAISPILYNLGIILGIIFLKEEFGIYSAAIGVLIGAFLHCLIRIIDTTVTEYKYKIELKTKHPGLKTVIKLMIPKSISLIAWQINLYLFSSIGMQIVEGGFAAFNYARNIQSFAVSLFGIAFATAIFPSLTQAVNKKNPEKYTEHIQKTIQRILFFTVPAMLGLIIMNKTIIEIILSGGIFDEKSVQLTSIILVFFAISIPFESLVHILARAFYAIQNTITPMIINLIAMFTIGGFTIFVAPKYGIKWFSIGFSVGLIIQVGMLILLLKKHFKNFKTKDFIISISKTIASSTIMVIVLMLSAKFESKDMEKLFGIITIIIGGTSFFIAAALLKSPELSSVKYIIDRILKKETNKKNA